MDSGAWTGGAVETAEPAFAVARTPAGRGPDTVLETAARDDVVVLELGVLQTLKRFKDEVNEVQAGQECGMAFAGFQDIKVGDHIECFNLEEVKRTL